MTEGSTLRCKSRKEINKKRDRVSRTISNSPKITRETEGLDMMQSRNSITKNLEQI